MTSLTFAFPFVRSVDFFAEKKLRNLCFSIILPHWNILVNGNNDDFFYKGKTEGFSFVVAFDELPCFYFKLHNYS